MTFIFRGVSCCARNACVSKCCRMSSVSITSEDFVDDRARNESQDPIPMGDPSTPLLKGPRKHPGSQMGATRTLMNLLKGMIGPGCLSLPLAFKQCGLWTGLVLVVLIGFMNTHCMQLLVECAHYLCDKTNKLELDYGHLAKKAFDHGPERTRPHSKKALYLINFVLIVLQLGICAVLFVFMAAHVEELFRLYDPSAKGVSVKVYLAMLLLPVILINFIRTLRVLAIISAIGNVIMLIAFGIVFINLAIISFSMDSSQLPWITDFKSIILGIGSILYAFEGQAMILPLENKMKRPWRMLGTSGVLWTGMSIVTCVYATTGFFGFASYHEKVQGSITLNFPSGWLFDLVKILLIMVVYMGYPLQLYVVIGMIWPAIRRKLPLWSDGMLLFLEYAFRVVLVLITFVIAVLVPRLEVIIPLVGVSAGMIIAFVFPPFLDSITFWSIRSPDSTIQSHETMSRPLFVSWVAKNVGLMILGVCGLIAGLYANVQNIIASS